VVFGCEEGRGPESGSVKVGGKVSACSFLCHTLHLHHVLESTPI
jgi:hypothetical protein